MKPEQIQSLHARFEQIVQIEEENGVEFWRARDLYPLLGYNQWRNFVPVIEKAIISCQQSGSDADDHFARARKPITGGKGAVQEVDDWLLTRYACYLIAQNGDPRKSEIAFAQTYFAVQTRKMEIIQSRLAERERLLARQKLTESEKVLSGLIFERLQDEKSFAKIRSLGEKALFGGLDTRQMKKNLDVLESRPLAGFLPTITIKAKDFANEITTFNIERNQLSTEGGISREHVKNNAEVRKILVEKNNIYPEKLPPVEDVKKVKRRHDSESKKIQKEKKSLKSDNPPATGDENR